MSHARSDQAPEALRPPKRRLVTSVLALVGWMFVLAAPAGAVAVVEGRLLNSEGQPTAGRVVLTASPSRAGSFPSIGASTVGRDGRFSIRVTDPSVLQKYTPEPGRSRRGDYTAYGFLANGKSGHKSFTALLRGRDSATRLADAKTRRGVPTISLQIDKPPPPAAARRIATQSRVIPRGTPYCPGTAKVIQRTVRSTVLGELNNAYNDGTFARLDHAGAWGKVGVSTRGRESRKTYTDYRFEKIMYAWGCTQRRRDKKVRTIVRAQRFLGGGAPSIPAGGLNRCRATSPGAVFPALSEFRRKMPKAPVPDDDLRGFGTPPEPPPTIRLLYRFGGGQNSLHSICGQSVEKESPVESARVLSGLEGGG